MNTSDVLDSSCLDALSNLSWPDNGNGNKRLKLFSICSLCRSLLEKCNIHAAQVTSYSSSVAKTSLTKTSYKRVGS
jgi:hypothetical protein